MAKYKVRVLIVEAEVYAPGMEDGFSCIPLVSACRWQDNKGKWKQCGKCELDTKKMPFVNASHGRVYIEPGDIIVTEPNGDKQAFDKKEFDATYEKAD